jgi:hypothetical protein
VAAWSKNELRNIAETDDLHIAPLREDAIDDAYRAKYAGSPYLGAMIGARARAATIRVAPLTPRVQWKHETSPRN